MRDTFNAPMKGSGAKNAKYAHGGDCCSSRSVFMKVPDAFRHDTEKVDYKKVGKGGSLSKMVEKKA